MQKIKLHSCWQQCLHRSWLRTGIFLHRMFVATRWLRYPPEAWNALLWIKTSYSTFKENKTNVSEIVELRFTELLQQWSMCVCVQRDITAYWSLCDFQPGKTSVICFLFACSNVCSSQTQLVKFVWRHQWIRSDSRTRRSAIRALSTSPNWLQTHSSGMYTRTFHVKETTVAFRRCLPAINTSLCVWVASQQ